MGDATTYNLERPAAELATYLSQGPPLYEVPLADLRNAVDSAAAGDAVSMPDFIGGHLGRLGTREDLALHQQYMADIAESSRQAIDTADLTRFFAKYPDNPWAAFRGGLEEMVATAAAPVIEKYTGVLAAADVFTESTTFQVLQSIRLDRGHGSWVHP